PGLKVVYENGLPTLKLNNYMVVILIDGGGLPIELGVPPTVEDLIEEISKFQIAQFKGMEVMYSEGNMINYLQPRYSWIHKVFKGWQIANSQDSLKRGLVDEGDPWIYKPLYKPGYLENRVNVSTNITPEIASIDITTKSGNGWFRNRAPSVVTYRPLPVMYPQQFYSPKYNITPKLIEPDYRSTIYWQPNIYTDQNGKAKVMFYTSDIKDKFTVKISGVDATGGIGDNSIKLNQLKNEIK
ncbi:MAG: hypothetical protein V4560_04685, partial [Bacteroidota bacterium]